MEFGICKFLHEEEASTHKNHSILLSQKDNEFSSKKDSRALILRQKPTMSSVLIMLGKT